MSDRNKRGRRILSGFLYILAILALLGCLGFLYCYSRKQDDEEAARLEVIKANEQQPEITGAKIMGEEMEENEEDSLPLENDNSDQSDGSDSSEPQKDTGAEDSAKSKPESGKKKNKAQEETVNQEPDADSAEAEAETIQENSAAETEAAETQNVEIISDTETQAARPEETTAESVAAPETEGSTEATTLTETDGKKQESSDTVESGDLKQETILVLNGSYKDGIAAVWQEQLQDLGYEKVVTGSYSGRVEMLTAIYTDIPGGAEPLLDAFPNAEIREGELPTTYTLSDGAENTDEIHYVIVVGIRDSVNN